MLTAADLLQLNGSLTKENNGLRAEVDSLKTRLAAAEANAQRYLSAYSAATSAPAAGVPAKPGTAPATKVASTGKPMTLTEQCLAARKAGSR